MNKAYQVANLSIKCYSIFYQIMLIFVQKIQTKNQIALCLPRGGLGGIMLLHLCLCLAEIIDAAETDGGMNWNSDQEELAKHLNMAVNV